MADCDPFGPAHPWPASKRGGADPDRCPECQQATYVRRQEWDRTERRWRRPHVHATTCSNCGTTWELTPLEESPAGSSNANASRRPLRLAIVGSRSLDGNAAAAAAVAEVLDAHQAEHGEIVVISGGARGIDRLAAAEARRRGLAVEEYEPAQHNWDGYRARDQVIAETCDELVRIADRRSRTYGSGWTRDRARELGKPTSEIRVDSLEAPARPRSTVEAER